MRGRTGRTRSRWQGSEANDIFRYQLLAKNIRLSPGHSQRERSVFCAFRGFGGNAGQDVLARHRLRTAASYPVSCSPVIALLFLNISADVAIRNTRT